MQIVGVDERKLRIAISRENYYSLNTPVCKWINDLALLVHSLIYKRWNVELEKIPHLIR